MKQPSPFDKPTVNCNRSHSNCLKWHTRRYSCDFINEVRFTDKKKKFKEKVPGETLRRNVLELISTLKWGAGDDV